MLFCRKIRCSRKYWVLTNTSPLVYLYFFLISYNEILDTDTRRIEMHRIKSDLVEYENKFKFLYANTTRLL